MSNEPQTYRAGVTAVKAIYAAVQTLLGVMACIVAIYAAVQDSGVKIPATFGEFQNSWPVIVVPLCVAICKAGANIWKHRDKDGNPVKAITDALKMPDV